MTKQRLIEISNLPKVPKTSKWGAMNQPSETTPGSPMCV